jgi:hypothetical protein
MQMRACMAGVLAVGLVAAAPRAKADWLSCVGSGKAESGPFVLVTTVAEVGAVPAARLKGFEARLLTYAKQVEPTLSDASAHCSASDDQVAASSADDRLVEYWGHKVGYEHLLVVQPVDWLPLTTSGGDIFHP